MSTLQPTKKDLSAYSAKIKDVYVEVDDYWFFHSPYALDKPDERFIGRRKIVNHLKAILRKSSTKSGAYLITGFRGMGKTSVVRKAITEVNHELIYAQQKKTSSHSNGSEQVKQNHPIHNPSTSAKKTSKRASKVIKTSLATLANFLIIVGGYLLFGTVLSYFLAIPFKVFIEHQWFYAYNKFEAAIPEGFLLLLGLAIIMWLIIFSLTLLLLDSIIWLINIIIRKRKDSEADYYKSFEINLSQESIKEIDILKQIARRLQDYWEEKHRKERLIIESRNLYFAWNLFYKLLRKKAKEREKEDVRIKLQNLNNRINAQVTSQRETVSNNLAFNTGLLNAKLPFFIKNKKDELSYPFATNKEIEQDLIEILKLIDNYRNTSTKQIPLFIFVIDELDKIIPNSSSTILERESADPYFDPTDSTKLNIVRQRQEAVANLLANLKGFLNVAMAKFIFIGGREMYDASLADIADRDSFYSSIFNDVVYVNSFFKDKIQKRAGITRMTEAYLCGLLIPKRFLVEKQEDILKIIGLKSDVKPVTKKDPLDYVQKETFYSLKVYHLFLIETLLSQDLFVGLERMRDKEGNLNDLRIAKMMKIIFLLQNYIIYLTYRSNGSPKKLTTLIENLMVPGDDFFLKDKNEKYLVVETKNKTEEKQNSPQPETKDRLFLRFNYSTQFEIGLTSDIYRPYIIANSRFLKSLGDKILFSSAFIMDHLLKFHSFGFSLRNLELIPEVILVNKEPNLRLYIDQLLNYLLEGYLRNTLSSLFDYKFNSIIAIELRYLSKISELGSAAFNFTLDESLQIKRHYKRKLQELEKKYQDYQPIEKDNQFIHSISFIHNILGDLHYYDQEFDEALIHYNESIQAIRLSKENNKKLTRHQFFLWIRRNLKGALTLEQIGAYDSAYSYYRTLTIAIADRIKTHRYEFLKFDYSAIDVRTSPTRKPGIDNAPYQYIQVLFTPAIALIGLMEKYRFDGFTYLDLLKNEREVNHLLGIQHEPFSSEIKVITKFHLGADQAQQVRLFTLKADYLNNIGNLLYFKNKLFTNQGEKSQQKLQQYFPKLAKVIEDYYLRTLKVREETLSKIQDYRPSIFAYIYYYRSLMTLLQSHYAESHGKPEATSSPWMQCYNLCQPGYLHLTNSYIKLYIGNLLSNLGNCMLTMIYTTESAFDQNLLMVNPKQKDRGQSEDSLLKVIGSGSISNNDFSGDQNINFVLALYRLSGQFFRKANQLHAYSMQLRKMLYVVKDYVQLKKGVDGPTQSAGGTTELLKKCEGIAMEVVRAGSWNNDITNRPQILKYRDLLNIHVQARKTRVTGVLDNLAGMYPVKEAIILVENIRLKLQPDEALRPNLSFISGFGTLSNKFIRMQELRYLSDFYYQAFRLGFEVAAQESEQPGKPWRTIFAEIFDIRLTYEHDEDSNQYHSNECQQYLDLIREAAKKCIPKLFKFDKNSDEQQGEDPVTTEDVLAFLITQAISCKYEVIKIMNIYTPGYVASYNFLASAHYKMARWCRLFENIYFLEEQIRKAKATEKQKSKQNDEKPKRSIYQMIEKSVGENIGSDNLIYLDSNHHFELALLCYYRSIQLHTEGRAYRIEARKQFFLEDDYNDQLKHFSAAMERYRMNTGSTREKIAEIKKLSQDISILYEYDYYFPAEKQKEDINGKEPANTPSS